jgi:hypothetical protein
MRSCLVHASSRFRSSVAVRELTCQAQHIAQEASQLSGPIEVPEATVPITLKLPPQTVELLRKCARRSGLTIGAIVASALSAFLRALKRHG